MNDENEANELIFKKFKNDLQETGLKFSCILYIIIGITACFAIIASELELNLEKNGSTVFISLFIVCQIINIILIIYNKYLNRTYGEIVILMKKHILLYFIIIPLMAIVTIYLIVQFAIYYSSNKDANQKILIALSISQFIFLISTIILMINQGSLSEIRSNNQGSLSSIRTNDQESLNQIRTNDQGSFNEIRTNDFKILINKSTVILTIIGMSVSIIFYVTKTEIEIFKNLTTSYYNATFANTLNISNPLKKIDEYLFPTHIVFMTMSIGYLIGSLQSHFTNIENSDEGSSQTFQSSSFKISSFSIIIGVILIVLPTITMPFTPSGNANGLLIFSICVVLIYTVGMILSIIYIYEMRNWKKENETNKYILDKFLIWLGCFGQIIFAVGKFSVITQSEKIDVTKIIVLIYSFFLIMQISLQSIVINLITSRKIERPTNESLFSKCCPPVGLIGLNLGCLLITIYMSPISNVTSFGDMSVDLFHRGLHIFAICFTLIHRLHGTVFFAIFLSKIYN